MCFSFGGKVAFDRLCATFQVRIMRYHGDNGRYADKDFRRDILDKTQSLTFCGVGSHHSNGITERRIHILTEFTRVFVLYTKLKGPTIITDKLWSFVLRVAYRVMNRFFLDEDGKCPTENE